MYDGAFANAFATLTGGVFLTGFALYLGMNEFWIGLLAAMPFLVTVFQLPTAYVIERRGGRKQIAYRAAAGARLTWIPILLVALSPISPVSTKWMLIVMLFFVSQTFIAVSYVSWLSWTSGLVPDEMRGRFFGTRNMLAGAAGLVVMFVFGHLLDYVKHRPHGGLSLGFGITFMVAVFFGMYSLRFLRRITERSVTGKVIPTRFPTHVSLPFKNTNFRKFLAFTLVWNFSVYVASPFFTLYFLRDLKLSYGFVASLGMLSAFGDLLGMRIWGRVSDRVKNKVVIRIASCVAALLPGIWVLVRPGSVLMPILLHIVGAGFWAGINLCMNNLLLRIAPQENRSVYLSMYHMVGGLSAAIAPIAAGLAIKSFLSSGIHVLWWHLSSVPVIFVISTILRFSSLPVLKYVQEPEEISVGELVRILRSVRGLNMANGFSHLLHPFIAIVRNKRTLPPHRG